jgi:PhnB protein
VSIVLYVPDVDTVFARAVNAGGKSRQAVADQFYGDRMGTLVDPFGHVWTVGTHTEDLSPEEMKKRMAAAHG